MSDGTTPLMTAVKLAIEEMVEDLLKAKADVNAADSHGTFECYLCNLFSS
jgi:ankyrin repeat protein